MNKIILGLGVIVVILIGWFYFQNNDPITYTKTIDDELTQLEAELAEVDASVLAGTLSPEAAAQAQVRIMNRINSISEAVDSSTKAVLSPDQKTMLLDGLDRLKNILTKYKDTLTTVDTEVLKLPEAERPKLSSRRTSSNGSATNSITAIITESIDIVEEHVEEVVEDYLPEDEEIVDEETTENMDDSSQTDTNDEDTSTMDDNMDNEDSDNTDDTSNETPETDESMDDSSQTNETDGTMDEEATSTTN